MSLVILNDELVQMLAQPVVNSVMNKLRLELDKVAQGNGDPRKVADICTEIASLARQINEHARKTEVKF